MNFKRVAGIINLIAAVIFLTVGLMARPMNGFYVAVGVIFLLLGIVRLRQTPPGPPA
ncbi:MAG TPA: hypothetical protein VFO55_12200 [Gemmatimonadaceae bacterium]|nr:hypothetical protein [Gemmatimonadaceae bacterium]